jgi:para-aminobenzoate synthetase component I
MTPNDRRDPTSPERQAFLEAARPGRHEVLLRRIAAASPTPRQLFRSLPPRRGNVLLDSQSVDDPPPGFSIIAFEPEATVTVHGVNRWRVTGANQRQGEGNPFPIIEQMLRERETSARDDLPFTGGAIGYFGYELLHLFEDIDCPNPDPLGIPDLLLFFHDRFFVRDHRRGEWIVGTRVAVGDDAAAAFERGEALLDRLVEMLHSCAQPEPGKPHGAATIAFLEDEATYLDRVARIREHIRNGDVYQVNYSQRCRIDCPDLDPWRLFEAVSTINPAPHSAFIDAGDFQVVSNSPELLVKIAGRSIWDRPLAGTIRRDASMDVAEQFAGLVADPKEAAEHRMLVDLERNDLGRICRYGTVEVTDLMIPEVCSHLIHIRSDIVGRLRDDVTLADVFRAVFPGGTITGVPKVRCMEILEKLESFKRSIFYGSIGLLSSDGQLRLSILIRTMLAIGEQLYFQVGGGVVADSDPQREYRESRLKAEAMLEAVIGTGEKPSF